MPQGARQVKPDGEAPEPHYYGPCPDEGDPPHHYTITVETGNSPDTPQGFEWRSMQALEGIPLTTIARKAVRLMTEPPKPRRAAAA